MNTSPTAAVAAAQSTRVRTREGLAPETVVGAPGAQPREQAGLRFAPQVGVDAYDGAQRRPAIHRAPSSSDALPALPSERPEVVEDFRRRLADAVARARATGVVARMARPRTHNELAKLASKLAGKRSLDCNLGQIRHIVGALHRPEPRYAPPSPQVRRNVPLAYATPTVEQPSVRPLFVWSDALLRQAGRLCDPLAFGQDTAQEGLTRLHRAALVLLATRNALDTYDAYTRTPGHELINRYHSDLRAGVEAIRGRIAALQRSANSSRRTSSEGSVEDTGVEVSSA